MLEFLELFSDLRILSGLYKFSFLQWGIRIFPYIPLISQVRGPYGKLWTEFLPSFYDPSMKRAGHENKEGKNEDP